MNVHDLESDGLITEINVTPFVDVVLVLLILFMLAAPAVYQSALKVKLPTVTSASKVKHVTLHFFVSSKGEIQVDRERIQAHAVEALVKRAISIDPNADAMISADKSVAHGNVIEIIDLIKTSGIHEVALAATERKI